MRSWGKYKIMIYPRIAYDGIPKSTHVRCAEQSDLKAKVVRNSNFMSSGV